MNVLADSGYFVGLFNPKDHHHARCKTFFAGYSGQTITTWAVFTEVCALLPHSKQKAFFAWASKAQALGYLRIESPAADAVATLWNLMDKYDDLPMDFCDASLVYLATSLKIHRIATVDRRDFSVYRLPGNKRFMHVLDEGT
jgi:predicted nucleic acid-binding protein